MTKFTTADQIAARIPDGAVVAIPGNASILVVDHLLQAIERRFLKEGHPRGLTAYLPCTASLGPGTGLDRLAHEGCLKRIIAGSYPIYQGSPIVELVASGKVEAYNLPMGILYALLRETAAGRDGVLTEVGLGTFVDPRQGGGRLNAATTEELVELVQFQGRERLFYRAIPIDVALLKATSADANGNLSMEQEPQTLGARAMAMAARASGGMVFAQVTRESGPAGLHARSVVVPSNLVDQVVLAPEAPQSGASLHDPSITGETRVPLDVERMPVGPERIILMRAAQHIRPGWFVNVGVGIGIDLARLLHQAKSQGAIMLSTEHGAMNGLPMHQPTFGAHKNPEVIIDPTDMFDMYDGGLLDATFLGMAEADELGNINVSRFGGRLMGCGGFIDITSRTKNLFFCGLLAAAGANVSVEEGRLRIHREGRIKKLVKRAQQITLNGPAALKKGQSVTLITERGLFRLTERGWILHEVAPGVDPARDIAPMMEFELQVARDLREYEAPVLTEAGSDAWLREKIGVEAVQG